MLVSGWGEAGVDDAPGSIWVVIRELGVVRANPDRVQSETRSAFVAQTPELLIHDLDGNLARDGRWMYYWDAENRLTRVITVAGPSSSFRRVEWKYDAWGRRTRQTSYVLSNGVWQVVEDLKLVSDPLLFGRHIAELNATNNAPVRAYIWGLDVSETLDGAGGVAGLLWVRMATGPAAGTHFVCYDGNGNVWNLVSASTGSETARYEYGPFGEPVRLSGPAARTNPFRFSTKRTEDFTGLVLYEYRVYNPSFGRWLSRDPIEDLGFSLKGCCQSQPPEGRGEQRVRRALEFLVVKRPDVASALRVYLVRKGLLRHRTGKPGREYAFLANYCTGSVDVHGLDSKEGSGDGRCCDNKALKDLVKNAVARLLQLLEEAAEAADDPKTKKALSTLNKVLVIVDASERIKSACGKLDGCDDFLKEADLTNCLLCCHSLHALFGNEVGGFGYWTCNYVCSHAE